MQNKKAAPKGCFVCLGLVYADMSRNLEICATTHSELRCYARNIGFSRIYADAVCLEKVITRNGRAIYPVGHNNGVCAACCDVKNGRKLRRACAICVMISAVNYDGAGICNGRKVCRGCVR